MSKDEFSRFRSFMAKVDYQMKKDREERDNRRKAAKANKTNSKK